MLCIHGSPLYQWDRNRQLKIDSVDIGSNFEIHCCHKDDTTSLVVAPIIEGNVLFANIPNVLLQRSGFLRVYVVVEGDTIYDQTFYVMARQKPDDYVYTETEVISYIALEKRISNLEKGGGSQGSSGVYVGSGEMPDNCNVQIDPTGEYTPLVLTINGKSPNENGNIDLDVPSCEGGESITIEKVEESDLDGGNNIVTFSDGNSLTVKNGSKGSSGVYVGSGEMPEECNVQIDPDGSETEIEDYLREIVNAEVAEQTRNINVPTKISQLENDEGFIKKTADNLTNYYTKEQSYSKSETNALIGNIPKFTREVVDVLPEIGKEKTLYLLRIPNTDTSNPNMFEEWIWEGKWEVLGSQNINLVDYVRKSEISAVFKEFMQGIVRVGYIYASDDPTDPAEIFGFGTWERIKDTFLLAAGDAYEAGTSGGEATHTLLPKELPRLGGKIVMHSTASGTNVQLVKAIENGQYTNILSTNQSNKGKCRDGGTIMTSSDSIGDINIMFGENAAHNNMPPYFVTYVWRRIS